ncbi:SpoIID/LytB domain-containing protein [Lachnospiraceae bacterium ZAX-1]
MREKIKTFFSVCLLMIALPYIITLLLQGERVDNLSIFSKQVDENFENSKDDESGLKVDESKLIEEMGIQGLDIEKYLIGVVAKEISITYEEEMLKAQAVIARTNLLRALKKREEQSAQEKAIAGNAAEEKAAGGNFVAGDSVQENSTEAIITEKLPDALDSNELLDLWGKDGFTENYQTLVEAIESTKGQTIMFQQEYIDAAFHAVSAGKTRSAKEALGREELSYLDIVESFDDIPSVEFLKVVFYEKPEFIAKILKKWDNEDIKEVEDTQENLMEKIKIVERDSAEYVTQIQIGSEIGTGEEFRDAFGLNSSCFYIAEVEGSIRIVTKGLGHGLGLSQYGGNQLAKSGKKYEEILQYYYKNIDISIP